MKKLFISTLILVFAFSYTNAQESTFNVDDKVINIGIGLGNTMYSGLGIGLSRTSMIPPISISFEKGIVDNVLEKGVIGIGGYIGYTSSKWNYSDIYGSYNWNFSNIVIGARGTFHYPLVDKFDTYAGLMLGYNIANSNYTGTGWYDDLAGTSPSVSRVAWSMYIGGRYWFNEKIAGMFELGYGISYLNVGVAFKL